MRHTALTPPPALDSATSGAPPARPREPGRGRRTFVDRKLTEGSIPGNLFSLAWPQMIAGALTAVGPIADLVWAGIIGARALASIGVAQGWVQLFSTGRMGLDTATRAMVARAVGAGDYPLANYISYQSLLLNTVLSAIMCVLGIVFTDALMQVLGVSDAVLAEGATYMRWQFVALFTLALSQSSVTILQAAGHAVAAMNAQILTRLLQIVLSPLLVFGVWVFPEMGLAGASIATALAQAAGAVVSFYVLFSGRARIHLTFDRWRPDLPMMWRMTWLGAPSSVTTAERSFSQIILIGMVTPFGDLALAAYSITNRVQQFVGLGSQGLSQACGVLVGQNLGAHHEDRARTTVKWALVFAFAANLLVGGGIFLFPEQFLLLFTRDTALLAVAVPWLHVQVVAFIIWGLAQVYQMTFNTAGDTFIPMIVTLGSIWLVQQPAAIMLSGVAENWELFGWHISVPAVAHMGQMGIAWAAVLAMATRLVFYSPYFIWGPWHKKQVL